MPFFTSICWKRYRKQVKSSEKDQKDNNVWDPGLHRFLKGSLAADAI